MGWKAACSDAEAGSWQQGILGVKAAGGCQWRGWGTGSGRDTAKAGGRLQCGSPEAGLWVGGAGFQSGHEPAESLPL